MPKPGKTKVSDVIPGKRQIRHSVEILPCAIKWFNILTYLPLYILFLPVHGLILLSRCRHTDIRYVKTADKNRRILRFITGNTAGKIKKAVNAQLTALKFINQL